MLWVQTDMLKTHFITMAVYFLIGQTHDDLLILI